MLSFHDGIRPSWRLALLFTSAYGVKPTSTIVCGDAASAAAEAPAAKGEKEDEDDEEDDEEDEDEDEDEVGTTAPPSAPPRRPRRETGAPAAEAAAAGGGAEAGLVCASTNTMRCLRRPLPVETGRCLRSARKKGGEIGRV